MYQYARKQLSDWETKANHKPLIIEGTRQVGKNWLMKEFGKNEYEKTIYINVEQNVHARNLFLQDLSLERIEVGLELLTNTIIKASNTLIIFDEIQCQK